MKIITIVGARPQFIKAAAVSRAISRHNQETSKSSDRIQEITIHTGQHYDHNMYEVFFSELEIPEPDINLRVGSGSHGQQTGQMLMRIEKVILLEKPDLIIVYGDTNSTLAGALAAVKLHIPIAHIEAGLRSFNRVMPEEHNRVLTDHCSNLLFCPTKVSVENLKNEGIISGVHLVGDVMYDSVLYNVKLAEQKSKILKKLKLEPRSYALATVHRAENTDDLHRLKSIFEAFQKISSNGLPVVVPLHPRTQKIISESALSLKFGLIIEPVSYLDMLLLEKHAKLILTDSGGVQKEAYWMKVTCITLRDQTEWVETVEAGWNILAGANTDKITKYSEEYSLPAIQNKIFGDGQSANKIVNILIEK